MVSNKRIKQRDGEWVEKPMYIDAECWGSRAEFAAKHVKKGTVLSVTGELEQDEWGEGENKRQKHKVYVSYDLQVDRFADADRKANDQNRAPAAAGATSSSDGGSDLPF
jgi:single-stranded DNA-binding protein